MSSKINYTKSTTEGGIKALSFIIFKEFIIPVGAPLLTIFFGYLNNLPLFYIWIGFLASFALTFHGLVKLNEWLYKIRVENKIGFTGILAGEDIITKGISVQIRIESQAEYPIDARIKILSVQIGDKVPLAEDRLIESQIPAYGYGWKNSAPIKIETPPAPGFLEGHIEYIIEYGIQKNFKYQINGKKKIVLNFNFQGIFESIHWHDAV